MLALKTTDWEARTDAPAPSGYSFCIDLDGGTSLSMTAIAMHSDTQESATSDSKWLEGDVEVSHQLVKLFSQVPEVCAIFIKFQDDEFIVWTILKDYDREARDRIYDRELEICAALRVDNFDFRVTSKDLMSPDELNGAGYFQIFSKS